MAANRCPLVAVVEERSKTASADRCHQRQPSSSGGSCPELMRSAAVRTGIYACAMVSHAVRSADAPSRTALVRRARKIDRVLAETYPDAKCELDFDNPFELLVVTVLSAQTTDKRVNAVRPTLFAAYPDAAGDGRRRPRRPRADHRPARLLPRQDRVAAQAQRRPRRAVRRRGAAPPRRPGHACPASAARPPTSCSATPSASPASPSTPTSAGSPAGSAGPRRPTRSRSSTPSARCSPSATGRCSATT